MYEQYSAEREAENIIRQAFSGPATTEESLREFLAGCFGPSWHDCALQSNQLDGRVIYTASKLVQTFVGLCQMVYVVDRDALGQWYVAPPSPVAGYE